MNGLTEKYNLWCNRGKYKDREECDVIGVTGVNIRVISDASFLV